MAMSITLEEAKQINKRKYIVEWQCEDRDEGELRLADADDSWGGYMGSWKNGLKKYRGSGHLCIYSKEWQGQRGWLEDQIVVKD
jgi:hypothetical protein